MAKAINSGEHQSLLQCIGEFLAAKIPIAPNSYIKGGLNRPYLSFLLEALKGISLPRGPRGLNVGLLSFLRGDPMSACMEYKHIENLTKNIIRGLTAKSARWQGLKEFGIERIA